MRGRSRNGYKRLRARAAASPAPSAAPRARHLDAMKGQAKRFLNHGGKAFDVYLGRKQRDGDVSFLGLWRHASAGERAATAAGAALAALGAGGALAGVLLYGELTALFVARHGAAATPPHARLLPLFGGGAELPAGDRAAHMDALLRDAAAFAAASAAVMALQLAAAGAGMALASWAAARTVTRLRLLLLRAVIRQEMAFFDTDASTSFAAALTDDTEKLRAATGEHVAMAAYLAGTVAGGVALALAYGWRLALAALVAVPAALGAAALAARRQAASAAREAAADAAAGRAAEEALAAVRTVRAYGAEALEERRYAAALRAPEREARARGASAAAGAGAGWLLTYGLSAVVLAYGAELCARDMALPAERREYHPGVLVTVLFAAFMAAQNVAVCPPHLEAFSAARGAARGLFALLERRSAADPLDERGLRPAAFRGDVRFEDVHFAYPSRPDVPVLRGLTLHVRAGETVALVGPSGSGKSTVLQLLQRLYEPASGRVALDGHRLPDLNLSRLRGGIGVVGQEPVLFEGSVRDNIALGADAASDAEVAAAAEAADAHGFIAALPDGYATQLGAGGAALSGGQKQRVALARALLRRPALLLLDEPTSALDAAAERRVQAALDAAGRGRTTLVVSHRLATVEHATRIAYMEGGAVREQGTHDELMAQRGLYWRLVAADRDGSAPATTPAAADEAEEPAAGEEAPAEAAAPAEAPRASQASLLRLHAPEWPLVAGGALAALVVGATMPAFALLFSKLYAMFSWSDGDALVAESRRYAAQFAGAAALCGAAAALQTALLARAGARLTRRLRERTFRAFLRREQAWHDAPANAAGALAARLAADCAAVQGATGARLGAVLQGLSTLLLGVALAALYSWKMTLVSLLSVPCVIGAIRMEGRAGRRARDAERRALEHAARVAAEAARHARTVQGLGAERAMLARYEAALGAAGTGAGRARLARAAAYGLCRCAPTLGYAVSLAYGGYLVAREGLRYEAAILVSEALIYGAWMLAEALSFAPSFAAAQRAGARILAELAPRPAEAEPSDEPAWRAEGEVAFEGVAFAYPARSVALRGLSLRAAAGRSLALVGRSGCGKSTLLRLLLREYAPAAGRVALDGRDARELPARRWRAQLALVPQEPALFARTIRENIAYGDPTRDVPLADVVRAATEARVHAFVAGLPLGYDTLLGGGGAALSGGQKQRVALARALLREPRVLLLDEATSALDAASEREVQAALAAAARGRTTLMVAHRLATVRHADTIAVLDGGAVAESGSHDELLRRRGLYWQLLRQQEPAA